MKWMAITFLLFLSVTSIQCISESRRIPRASGNRHFYPNFPKNLFILDKEFSETVNNLKYIATISSAISLEIGLIDGSISPYSAISDLLRMGSVKPEDMAGIDSKTINDALEKLEKLSENKPDEMIEKRFVDLEEMRIKESNEPSTISGLKEYQDALKAVEDLEGLKQSLTDITETLRKLSQNLKDLSNTKKPDNALGFMMTIYTSLKEIEDTANSFDATLTQLTNAEQIREASKLFLKSLNEEKTTQSKKNSHPALTDENVASLLENFNKAFDISKSVASSLPGFKSIRDLVSSRQPSFHHKFQYTSGLPSGPRDLALLKSNLRTPWVADRIFNHTFVVPNLEKAFLPFGSLTTTLKSVESSLWSLDDETIRKSVDEVVNTCLLFGNNSISADEISNIVNELKKCDSLQNPTSFEQKLEALRGTIVILNKEVSAISNFSYIDQFKNLSSVIAHFDTENLPNKNAEKALASNTMKILKTNSDIKTFRENAAKFSKDVNSLLDFISNSKSPSNVKTQLDNVQKEMNEFSTCLTDIKTKGDFQFFIFHYHLKNTSRYSFLSHYIYICIAGQPVKQIIEALQKTRAFSIDPNTKSTIDSIVKSGGELAKLKTKAEDFKKIEDKAVKVLNGAFPESAVVSQKLGLGVQGLEAIEKALEAKGRLKKLAEGLQKAQPNKLSAPQKKAIQDIQQLPEIFKSIDEFVTFLDGQNIKSTSDLNSLRSIFEKASKVKGVDIDMKILREVAESLKLPFDDDLEALDFNFARFKIADSVPSLVAMDEFFMKYAEAMTKPKPADTPSSQNEPDTATWSFNEKL
uniref:WSN domain-containing protein n=1 Tax=Caenorhabditis tropicalis TaxID=1561998 RepID=A0A1I7UPA0_9PELO